MWKKTRSNFIGSSVDLFAINLFPHKANTEEWLCAEEIREEILRAKLSERLLFARLDSQLVEEASLFCSELPFLKIFTFWVKHLTSELPSLCQQQR